MSKFFKEIIQIVHNVFFPFIMIVPLCNKEALQTGFFKYDWWSFYKIINNTIWSKKLACFVSKNVTCPFIIRKYRYAQFSQCMLLLYCGYAVYQFLPGRVSFFRPETIVSSFLHLTVLFYKVIINHILPSSSLSGRYSYVE